MKKISNIVFTKNRPLQLEGYLRSLGRFMPTELIQTYILYKPELFDAEYDSVFNQYPDCNIIREKDFHTDLLNIIGNIDTPYTLFGIDDVVYFDGVPWETIKSTFEKLGDSLFGFSLRLDKRQMPQDEQANNIQTHDVNDLQVFAVDWTKGQTHNTRYPFELCATVYRTDDIRRIINGVMSHTPLWQSLFKPGRAGLNILGLLIAKRKILKKFGFIYSPNTLESWCCRYVQNNPENFGNLLGFGHICTTAIQVNMVNTSTDNQCAISEELTVESLNLKFQQGCRLDIDRVKKQNPCQFHTDKAYFHLIDTITGGTRCSVV